jgi:hypothetical protein
MAARKSKRISQPIPQRSRKGNADKQATKKTAAKAKPKAAAKARPTAKPKAATKTKPKAATKTKPKAATKTKATTKRKTAAKPPSLGAGAQGAAKSKTRAAALRPTPARDALTAHAQKKRIESALSPLDEQAVVDSYLRDVEHPYKAEMQALRQIILAVSPKISERIKWNALSFHYREDLATFNPQATECAHLVLLFPGGNGLPSSSDWLEGTHKDRREAKFHSLEDVAKKKAALEGLLRRWVRLREG